MEITLHENITAYLQEKNLITNYPASGHGVICEAEDEILAYLYYSLDPYHPSAPYLRSAVLDESVDAGTIVEMFEKLKTTLPLSDLVLEVHRNHDLYKKLIDEYGFEKFRMTYEPEADVEDMIDYYHDTDETSAGREFEMTEELLTLSKKVYESSHDVIPLRGMSLAEWNDLITDDLDIENSITVYNDKEEISAYMLIYGEDEDSKDIGYLYFENPEAKQILTSEFKNRLNSLKGNGVETINLEVDTTDEYTYEFFEDFVEDETPVLVSYIRRQKKS